MDEVKDVQTELKDQSPRTKEQTPRTEEQTPRTKEHNHRKRPAATPVTNESAKSAIKLARYNSDRCLFFDETSVIKLGHGCKSQVKIIWSPGPRSCFMVKKIHDDNAFQQMKTMLRWLVARGITVYVEPSSTEEFPTQPVYSEDTSPIKIDFCISLGGDGTLLHLNSHFQKSPSVPPAIAFAAGTLGFLTPFSYESFPKHLEPILRGDVPLYCSLRMRLEVQIIRQDGSRVPTSPYQVLNEVLIDRGRESYLTELMLAVDRHTCTKIQADGVIVSTPTGSTAYSMSAGGSMVAPTVSAILLTPICPHTLSFRPLILPDSSIIEISIPPLSKRSAWASFDGRSQTQLRPGDRVQIKFSEYPVPSLNMSSYNTEWLQSIKNKLNWNQKTRDLPSPLHSSSIIGTPTSLPRKGSGTDNGKGATSPLPPLSLETENGLPSSPSIPRHIHLAPHSSSSPGNSNIMASDKKD